MALKLSRRHVLQIPCPPLLPHHPADVPLWIDTINAHLASDVGVSGLQAQRGRPPWGQ
jgi:hypothetical protein